MDLGVYEHQLLESCDGMVAAANIFGLLSSPTSSENQNHRSTESLRLEKTTKTTESNHQPASTMPTDHIPQCHISTVLEHLQRQ